MLKSKDSPNKTIRMELPNNRYKERPDIALAVQQIGEIKREKIESKVNRRPNCQTTIRSSERNGSFGFKNPTFSFWN